MAECEHYRIRTFQMESQEVREDRQIADVRSFRRPWCAHPKHSPAPRETTTTIGSVPLLTCEGTFAKCPLSRELFDDVE